MDVYSLTALFSRSVTENIMFLFAFFNEKDIPHLTIILK